MGQMGYSSTGSDSAWDTWFDLLRCLLTEKQFEEWDLYMPNLKKNLRKYKKYTATNLKKMEKKLVALGKEHAKNEASRPLIEQVTNRDWWVGAVLLIKKAGFKPSAKIKATARKFLKDELSTFQKGLNISGWKEPKKRVAAIKKELKLLK